MTGPASLDDAAERIAALEASLGELTRRLDGIQGTITDQAEVLRTVDDLKETVGELLHRFTTLFPDDDDGGGEFYTPIPTPRFWQLDGGQREQAVDRLRHWVQAVYLPVFGHLARMLPACWEQHTLCLTVLDVASELHSVLHLQPTRNQRLLAGQAELLTRLMPALASLMAAEGTRCSHAQARHTYATNGARR